MMNQWTSVSPSKEKIDLKAPGNEETHICKLIQEQNIKLCKYKLYVHVVSLAMIHIRLSKHIYWLNQQSWFHFQNISKLAQTYNAWKLINVVI